MINDYLSLSTRAGFNKSLGHFRMVTDIVKRMGQGENPADIVDALEKEKKVQKSQIGPILNAIVIDRMDYSTLSFNLSEDVKDMDGIQGEVEKWNRLDLFIAYHHPQLGITLINPKDKGQWESIQELDRDELVVIYALAYDESDRGLEKVALEALFDLMEGRKAGQTAKLGGGSGPKKAAPPPPPRPAPAAATPAPKPAPQAPAPTSMPKAPPPPFADDKPAAAAGSDAPPPPPAAPAAGGKARMTPKYSVQVTNELFHNGNVEAWKNIVESYKTKFPGLEVHIFHDGQKVNNINALFKWGKVKHGDVLLFSVSGEEIKGVAKLQRFLFEGASLRYENYLKKDVNKVLTLF